VGKGAMLVLHILVVVATSSMWYSCPLLILSVHSSRSWCRLEGLRRYEALDGGPWRW